MARCRDCAVNAATTIAPSAPSTYRSNRFRGYRLSDARKGKATKPFPKWGARFQGHSEDRTASHGTTLLDRLLWMDEP